MNDRMQHQARFFAGCQRDNLAPARRCGFVAALTAGFLAILVGSSTVAAGLQSSLPMPTRHMALTYEVHAGGLHVFSFDVGLTLDSEGYRISVVGGTRGISSILYKWDVSLKAEGESMRPERYVSVNTGRQPTKTMQLDFIEDGSFSVTRNLPEPVAETAEEAELPTRLPANIVDPLSAALVAAQNLATTGHCEQTLPVFDGKRRFDLTFHDVGSGDLPKSRMAIYQGAAVLCGLTMKRISGFMKPRRHVGQWDQDQDEPPTLWIAQVSPDMPPVPVRFTGSISLGSIVVHLTKIESSQEVASSAVP